MRITLLTDFGTADGYVAALKGAIAEIAPSILIDDASHAIEPGDVVSAAFTLRRYWRRYPPGTVHLVVVDPGVGSERRALIVEADERVLVGPDNGVFTFVLREAQAARVLEIPPDQVAAAGSRTFHGRDVFAPIAARIAAGEQPDAMASALTGDLVRVTLPPPIATEASVRGEIVQVDHFGNLVSNIPREMLQQGHVARIAEREVKVLGTYSDAESGELLALINSDGVVEIALRDANAARALNVERGAPLELHF